MDWLLTILGERLRARSLRDKPRLSAGTRLGIGPANRRHAFLARRLLSLSLFLVALLAGQLFGEDKTEPSESTALGSGDHERSLIVDEQKRSYLVHIPESYD